VPGSGRSRRRRLLAASAIAAGVLAPTGWLVTDRLEQDDAFCTSCHLPSGRPLHEAKHADFHGREPVSLAWAHADAGNARRADEAFRCIDCHGGVGPLGRTRVKLLSAKDAFWYAVGRFEEPDTMHWPLLDADCTRCHASFDAVAPGGSPPLFHELAEHNAALGVACVECHLAHEAGGLVDHHFLHAAHVRAQCARCHLEFEEESS
jgi:nitrate/TMAO reductase-like tetraheme cytochrome c subunit